MDNFDLRKYLAENKLLKEEKYNGAIIRKGTSDKAKEDTKIVRQALKDKGIKFTNRGEFGMDFKNADLAQIKKVIAGAKVGEFIVSHDVDEGKLLKEELIWKIEGESADISDAGPEYRADVESQIKAIHPNISDEDLEKAIDISNDQFYRSAREDNKRDFGDGDRSLSSDDFVKNAVEIYTTDILDEGKLLKEESIKDIENSWHGVIEILYSKDDFIKIMNAEKFEDLEEREQALIGRALKRWERESGKNMNVADYFKAVKNDLTTLSKNL